MVRNRRPDAIGSCHRAKPRPSWSARVLGGLQIAHASVPPGLRDVRCPTAITHCRGTLGERAFDCACAFRLKGGRCIDELSAMNSLGK